jgi:outer membrane protein insertion porin family
MRTDPGAVWGLALAATTLLAWAPCGTAQQAPLPIDADTEVRRIQFEFLDHRSFSTNRLRDQIALRAPGSLEFLPFFSSGPFPFSPLELQRDVARLRRYYRRSGFPDVRIDYTVRFDESDNQVDVNFLVREGEPLTRGTLTAIDSEGLDATFSLPLEIRAEWSAFIRSVTPAEGDRLGELERAQLEDRISGWLRNRGFPVAVTTAEVEEADPSEPADVEVVVEPGPRTRIASVIVEGAEQLDEHVVTRELPFGPGDWYSSARLAEGERELFGLNLVRVALADPMRPTAMDSTVDVRVRIAENLPRVISGQLGYATEAGVIGQADWAHRNFLGEARTLSVSLQGRSGSLVVGPNFQRRYAASTSLEQPYFLGRRRSLVITPNAEYRDDFRDRSVQAGVEAVTVRQWSALQTVSVHLNVSRRRIFDFRLTGTEGFDFRRVLVELDSLDHDVRTTALGVSVSWGDVDDAFAPRAGYLFRISGETTGPAQYSSAQYARIEASFARFVPFTARTGLVLRLAGGRLVPYGRSIPANDDQRTEALLRLRDALFTGGGRYDVRGWGEQQLGPKYPDVRLAATDPDTVLVADRYVPLGGLARVMGSAEIRLPLPGFSERHSTHVFLDAGRVWNPDRRFQISGIGTSALRFGTGAGAELGTPVGLVRLSVAYKLNPSAFDLRDPGAVFAALEAGTSPFDVPTESLRRWHIHVAIGQMF